MPLSGQHEPGPGDRAGDDSARRLGRRIPGFVPEPRH